MNSNYNDIIDVILTFTKDEEIKNNIALSGSIVPYLITNRESLEYHSDFYILVKKNKMNYIRSKIKSLSKVYQFDIVSDSKIYYNDDYGFKIKYENTFIGFFPYSLVNDNLIIKTFSIMNAKKEIKLKTKNIPGVSKSSVIKLINFSKDKRLRIMSPEFILADKEMREKQPGNPSKETMMLLNRIIDENTLDKVRKSVSAARVKIIAKPLRKKSTILIILIVGFMLLLAIAYICFKK